MSPDSVNRQPILEDTCDGVPMAPSDIGEAVKARSPWIFSILQFLVNAHVRFCYPGGNNCG